MNIPYYTLKFWEKLYDVSYFVFGNLPITYDIKHKMNMAYMKYQMSQKQK
ncbi:hypothetical protein SP40_125 [Salmonella phage 40]|nr:hypothetical protein SP40_125 [Salmonella phage 40]